MDDQDLQSNPFSALFPSLSVAKSFVASSSKSPESRDVSLNKKVDLSSEEVVRDVHELNSTIEDIFLVTLNKFSVLGGQQNQLVYLSSLAEIVGNYSCMWPLTTSHHVLISEGCNSQTWLDLPTLEQALFERLMLDNPLDHLVTDPKCKSLNHSQTLETQAVRYLASSYRRCCQAIASKKKGAKIVEDILEMKNLIVQNLITAFKEPDFYIGQNLNQQLSDMILGSFDVEAELLELLGNFARKIKQEEKENPMLLENVFHPILDNIKTQIKSSTLILFSMNTIIPLQYFMSSPDLARVFILHSFPKSRGSGRVYEDTVLGSILEKSCLPGQDSGPWEYFSQPSGQPVSVHSATEGRLWSGLESVHTAGQTVIKQLLKVHEDVKHFVLLWLANCLADNQGRGKLWTNQMGSVLAGGLAGDGFMLNLGSVLLRLCGPMTENAARMEKIEPSYPAKVTHVLEDKRLAQHHMENMASETCLVSLAESDRDKRQVLSVYNFPSEIFFMTHKCLDLGFRTVQEKFIKLNQELGRLQSAYRDASASGGEAAEMIQSRMEEAMQKYLTYKAALLEPTTLDSQTGLVAATASWLVKITVGAEDEDSLPSGQLPAADHSSPLSCLPEFIIENLCEHLLLVRRFNPSHFESSGPKLGSFLMVILCFMDQPGLVRNPHLRARLAESLECLLPSHEVQGQPNILGSYQRQALFQDHVHSMRVAPAILHVFVSIEETGHSVQFEQKFSYRRPMYDIIKYIWQIDEFKRKFRELATEAERDIESEQPPLFLRFINLLINDAIFLLDEGLLFMKQIQEKEAERADWSARPERERAEAEASFRHMTMMARYHNIMGMETISVLELLTSSITEVITHPTMADR